VDLVVVESKKFLILVKAKFVSVVFRRVVISLSGDLLKAMFNTLLYLRFRQQWEGSV
jgi:hypothetical protein